MNFVVIKFVDKVLNQCRSKLTREKKRAVARLEKLASEFKNKKKALIELNISIEERRQQLIADQMDLKKKYEPDAYERILKESQKESI